MMQTRMNRETGRKGRDREGRGMQKRRPEGGNKTTGWGERRAKGKVHY
jgi:hypothetical protein